MKWAAASFLALSLILSAWAGGTAFAQQERAGRRDSGTKSLAGDSALTQGEIRKVDKQALKLTIRHGPIRNLDMPAMTMVFRVKDPVMLEKLKTGDRIDFVADNVGGALTVVRVDVRR